MHWKRVSRLLWAFALVGTVAAGPALAQVPPGKTPPQQIQPKGLTQPFSNQGQSQTSVGWQWNTKSITTAPLTIYGTGSLGLNEALQKWDTKKVTTAALTIYGTGSLGLADALQKWDTKKVTSPALTIYGTGSLNP